MTEFPEDYQEIERERRENTSRDVALVTFINPERELLLVRTPRFPTRWQPVGGGIAEMDRSVLDALTREVMEEVGVNLEPNSLRSVMSAPYDFGEGVVHFYVANLPDGEASLSVDYSQVVEHRWWSLREALTLPVFPATLAFLKQLAEEHDV